jgi:CBS domain-containing protein
MSPRRVSENVVREVPLLRETALVRSAVEQLVATGQAALPVVDGQHRYAGVFGEREFMTALFPGYLKEISYAGFVPRALEEVFEKRGQCAEERIADHMLTEHVDVGPDHSDLQVAETFLHHRVLIVPVVDDRRVLGIITRSDFFRLLAEHFLDSPASGSGTT